MKTKIKFLFTAMLAITIVLNISRCKYGEVSKEATIATATDTTSAVAKTADTIAAVTDKVPDAAAAVIHAPLTLIVTNLASLTAPVYIGLYGTKNKFPDPKDQLKEYKFTPHGNKLIAKISDLHFGVYALAIYQDVNNNGKIDKNLIGIPTEGYAFSNNFKPKVKAPSFDNCKFEYDANDNTLTMNLIQ
jgi:uncharacterized protein (DUF2141 family)